MQIANREHTVYGISGSQREVLIPLPGTELAGYLFSPPHSTGVVLFASGTGSARFNPRNQRTARAFNQFGLATLLIDLLSPAEEAARHDVFDVELLGHRVAGAVEWLRGGHGTRHLKVGIFSAGTGSAAALWAAAGLDSGIGAIVARGGRPELAGDLLKEVSAPTLLIVGERDPRILALNSAALAQLRNAKLEIVADASHHFEEPGASEWVENAAAAWFLRHLKPEVKRLSA